jgi:hypothetical protein
MLEQIKSTVVFLESSYLKNETRIVNGVQQSVQTNASLSGTGFLIGVTDSRLAPNRSFAFLVTNKHMIREPGPNGTLGEGP